MQEIIIDTILMYLNAAEDRVHHVVLITSGINITPIQDAVGGPSETGILSDAIDFDTDGDARAVVA